MARSDFAAQFDSIVAAQIAQFPDSRFVRLVEAGTVTIAHYHVLLMTLFHQTYNGPYTFARAGVNCEWRHEEAKEYLIQHAEEERTHWRWVLDDLASTGYSGPSPRTKPPHPSCQAYIGLNYYVSEHVPVARLAIAAVLEGIGAAHGGTYGGKLIKALNLNTSQASFFLSHGVTDQEHAVELREVIARCSLSPEEWMWMNHAAEVAGLFYRSMYDHEDYA